MQCFLKTQVVRFLLESEACADVNAKDIREMTPLHLAALTNGVDAGYELIRQGAKVNAQAKDDITPLMIAA